MGFLKRFAQGELGPRSDRRVQRRRVRDRGKLLVLELKVPILRELGSGGELGHQLVDLLPKFVSWLISFIIVRKFWLNHHHLLTFARHAHVWNDLAELSLFDGPIVHPISDCVDGRVADESTRGEFVWRSDGDEHAAL